MLIYFPTVDTNNNTLTWYVNLYPLTDTADDIPCNDTSNACCSIEYCDRSIVNQIEYYINKDNIKMYACVYLRKFVYITYYYICYFVVIYA